MIQVSSREDFMTYINVTLLPMTFPTHTITGRGLSWREKLFAQDQVSFRFGPIRIRQLRVKPGFKILQHFSWVKLNI